MVAGCRLQVTGCDLVRLAHSAQRRRPSHRVVEGFAREQRGRERRVDEPRRHLGPLGAIGLQAAGVHWAANGGGTVTGWGARGGQGCKCLSGAPPH